MLLDLRSAIYDVDDLQKAKEWYAQVLNTTFLMDRGFKIAEYLNPEEIETSYLTLKDGTLFGHVTGSFRIVKGLTTNQAS